MITSTYQRLLGLPVDLVTPDYVQLLGLPPDEEDAHEEAEVTAALADRLDRLTTAPGSDRLVVEHLRRELQRARATLLDPAGRARHLEDVRRRRLSDLATLVQGQLGAGRSLPLAAEQALVEAGRGWGLSADEAREALTAALAAHGAGRGDGPAPSLPALHAARERLRRAMADLADERLRQGAGVGPAEAGRSGVRRRATPPRPASALPPVAAEPPAAPEEEAGHWSAGASSSSPPSSPVDPAPAPPPAASEATPWPTIVRGEERARLERRSRRVQRTCLALAGLAAAYVVGDLLAAFAPVEAAWIDARTAAARARLLASPRLPELLGGAAAGAVALFGLLVWLAGREARRPFLAPLAVLAAPVAFAGLIPVGHERVLGWEREGALAQRDAVTEQARALALTLASTRDDARRREAEAVAVVTSLRAEVAATETEATERARRVSMLERLVRRYAADRRAQQDALRSLRAQVVGLEAEIADLTSSTSRAPAPPSGDGATVAR